MKPCMCGRPGCDLFQRMAADLQAEEDANRWRAIEAARAAQLRAYESRKRAAVIPAAVIPVIVDRDPGDES